MASEPTRSLRIGTRGSRLARWQSEWVAAELARREPTLQVELVEVRTHGDRDRNSPLAAIGGQGLFTKEIQKALVAGDVDVAVHSLKDLPTTGPEDLLLAAVPPREAVSDALIAPRHGTLDRLPPGSHVGTSSQRRRAMLRHARPDLLVDDLRGNVETRLRAAQTGALDAVILAEAGLNRLALDDQITERLGPPRFLPAVGQGALGIECRRDDHATRSRLLPLDDPTTHAAVVAERTLLAALEGGCVIPIGAWCRPDPDADTGAGLLRLDAAVYDPDGAECLTATASGLAQSPRELGLAVAADLIERGALRLLGR